MISQKCCVVYIHVIEYQDLLQSLKAGFHQARSHYFLKIWQNGLKRSRNAVDAVETLYSLGENPYEKAWTGRVSQNAKHV